MLAILIQHRYMQLITLIWENEKIFYCSGGSIIESISQLYIYDLNNVA